MSSGIVCKVWNIKGDSVSKGAKEQLRDSLGYILNNEKTEAQVDIKAIDQLLRECKYVENDVKTFSGAYVGGYNIINVNPPAKAVEEMMRVKDFYGKRSGRAALHLLISLPEEESKTENSSRLMQLCSDVIKEVFPNNQAVFAVHTNTENLHIHTIINSVGLDGRKIHQNKDFMKNVLQPCVNKYARKYGFSENTKWGQNELTSQLSYAQIKMILRNEVDQAIEKANTFEEFQEQLKLAGMYINVGKYISLKLPSMRKPVRTYNLGSNYTRDAIVERLATKRNKFQKIIVGNYVMDKHADEVFVPYIFEMKKYKDMSQQQKKEAVHQLKLGINPWRENKKMNWQLNNIANELNEEGKIRDYIDFYSNDGTIQGAMNGIINAKKQIAHDKKMIVYAKKKYKPILKIYEEMRQIERQAYLYEHQHIEEFRPEFEQYRELTRRLKNGYNKEVFEVAGFLQECEERLIYAHAQLNELSLEYRELKNYGVRKGQIIKNENDFVDILGYFEKKSEEKAGNFEADAFYISSFSSDVIIRVIKTPGIDLYGDIMEEYNLSVMDRTGKVIEEISNTSAHDKNFNNKLKEIQNRYSLYDCKRFGNFYRAQEYANKDDLKPADNTSIEKENVTDQRFSFTEGINHISDSKPVCVIVDSYDPNFIVISSKEGERLKITVMDQKQDIKEILYVPLVKGKNADGYKNIINLQKKYGFSDNICEFENLEKAHLYTNDVKNKKDLNKQRK